jgi:hypothetical protein
MGMEHLPQSGPLEVDCNTCVMKDTDACDDCLVSFICDRDPQEAVIITIDELRSMRSLNQAGLVPGLKHRRRTG